VFEGIGHCQRRLMWCAAMVAVVVTECMCCTLNLAQFAQSVRESACKGESV
jgi:hypothetical protein